MKALNPANLFQHATTATVSAATTAATSTKGFIAITAFSTACAALHAVVAIVTPCVTRA